VFVETADVGEGMDGDGRGSCQVCGYWKRVLELRLKRHGVGAVGVRCKEK
jgi:hypothetical protein